MTRHELNDVFATTSFLQGANAAYLEQLHASYQQAPNSVGPKLRIPSGPGGPVTDFVYGGDKLLLFVTEMEFPIYDPAGLRWVVFFDAGNAFSESENYSLTNLKLDAGFGLRWNSPMGPLRFEWGFPINPDPNDAPVVFNFTVGNFF